jgi:hypothetical protein
VPEQYTLFTAAQQCCSRILSKLVCKLAYTVLLVKFMLSAKTQQMYASVDAACIGGRLRLLTSALQAVVPSIHQRASLHACMPRHLAGSCGAGGFAAG